MFGRRKLNKKLDLLLKRQALMAEVLFGVELKPKQVAKYAKKFNKLWYEIMEGKNVERG